MITNRVRIELRQTACCTRATASYRHVHRAVHACLPTLFRTAKHLQYKAIINKRRQYSKALILVDEVEVCAVQNTNQETLLLRNVRSMGLAAL